ncbi:MAG: hypothetical protein HYW50_01955 [Candidatus Diapherotrites archaeon]|nr:hypothetical protein [Candidatus Diapherotrites archaeon]
MKKQKSRSKKAVNRKARGFEEIDMRKTIQIEKIKSGIAGFDEMLRGGIPVGSLVVLSGSPGSGKTIFCLQFIYTGISKYNENCVLVLLEESKEEIFETGLEFGWDFEEFVKKKTLKVLTVNLYDFEILKNNIEDAIRSIDAKRLVIDPGVIFKLFFEKELDARKNIVALGKIIKKRKCTTIITNELSVEIGSSLYGLEEYVADGVVLLYHTRVKNKFIRSIAIVKMRNTQIMEQLKPLSITTSGIQVHIDSELFT